MSERRRLNPERPSRTHKFDVGGIEGYVTVGMYEDGAPGEIFVKLAKEGSTLSGLVDSWAIAMSIALQHGAPLETLVAKFSGTRFEPCGYTGTELGYATSLTDYIMRWIALRFMSAKTRASLPPDEGTPCPKCGTTTVRRGDTWVCLTCEEQK